MFKQAVLWLSVVIGLIGCSQLNEDETGEVLYRYTGDLISLVDQRNGPMYPDENPHFSSRITPIHETFGTVGHRISQLEVWITPYSKDDWYIEAVEVVVLCYHCGS